LPGIGVTQVLAESFRIRNGSAGNPRGPLSCFAAPATGLLHIIIHPMMGPQPFALALVAAKHLEPRFNGLADVNIELWSDFFPEYIDSVQWLEIVKIRYSRGTGYRREAQGIVVWRGSIKASIPDEQT